MMILQEKNLQTTFKVLFKREVKQFENPTKYEKNSPIIIHNPQFKTSYGFKTPSSKSSISYLLLKKYLSDLEKGNQLNIKDRNAIRHETSSCGYCGEKISFESSSIDHIIPNCLGGQYTVNNIVICCTPCNRVKGSLNKGTAPKTYELFLKLVKRKKAIPKTNIHLLMIAKKYLLLSKKEEKSITIQINREITRISDYNKNKYIEFFKDSKID